MCGIAGYITLSRASDRRNLAERMISAVRHRGPDGIGIQYFDNAALAHARLSIIDLAGGSQPMANEDGTLWITANCEIFNYIELRNDLIQAGHRFATKSDTEVILHLFEDLGEECVKRLNGQWSFAIWNTKANRLFLSRDRMGIRPLFYTRTRERFLFASEIKSLFADTDVSRELDPSGLDQVFTYWCTVPPRTAFQGIRELPAGHSLTLEGASETLRRYWEIPFQPEASYPEHNAEGRNEQRYKEELFSLLTDATRLRIRADVPVGTYLSGGLDSTVTAALMRRCSAANLESFSATFEDPAYDESSLQREAVDFLATEHHEVRCGSDDIARVFPAAVWHAEAPILRTAPAPMYLLAEKVRGREKKVVLTGEGADEILGGYDIFKEAKIRRFWAAHPDSVMRPRLLRRLYPYLPNLHEQSDAYLKASFNISGNQTESSFFSHLPRWSMTSRLKRFFSDDVRAASCHHRSFEAIEERLPSSFQGWHWFAKAQYLESAYLLPGYILSSQGDRMAMAHGVETRSPFLDYRLVELASRLPVALKMKVLQEKYLLKHCATGLVPASILHRKKQPYRSPDGCVFFTKAGRAWSEDLVSETALRKTGIFHPGRVQKLVQKCRDRLALGAADNMALTGILSTQLLEQNSRSGFAT